MNALPRPDAAGEEPLVDVSVPSVERQLASYRQLVETAHLLLMGGSLAEVLNRVADALQRLLPFDALTIYVADNERRLLFPVLARDAWADSVLSQGATPFGTGIMGWVAEHLEPVNIAHDANDPRLRQIPGTPDQPEGIVVIPLIARETFRGVFALYREGGRDFSEDEFALAQLFSDQASLAIDSAAAHDALSASARTDSVTGLYNHRFFHEQLRAEINRAHRYRHEVSLVVLDLDDFKGVNDRYGHLEGDAVLHRLGALLAAEVRGNDAACRIGGEEFALILPHTDVQGATELAERVRATVRGTSFGKAGRLSISSGVATMPNHAQDVTSLIDRADAALYASKNAGKNRVTVYADDVATEREAPPTGDGRLSSLAVLENLAHRVAGLGSPRRDRRADRARAARGDRLPPLPACSSSTRAASGSCRSPRAASCSPRATSGPTCAPAWARGSPAPRWPTAAPSWSTTRRPTPPRCTWPGRPTSRSPCWPCRCATTSGRSARSCCRSSGSGSSPRPTGGSSRSWPRTPPWPSRTPR